MKKISVFWIIALIIGCMISRKNLLANGLNLAIISEDYNYEDISNLKENLNEFKDLGVDLFSTDNLPSGYLFYAVQIKDLENLKLKNFVLEHLKKSFIVFVGESTMGELSSKLDMELLNLTHVYDSATSEVQTMIHARDNDEKFSVFLYTENLNYLSLTRIALLPNGENELKNYLVPVLELYSQVRQEAFINRASVCKDGTIGAIYTNTATNTYYTTKFAVSRDAPENGRQVYYIEAYTYFNKNGYSLDIEHAGNVNYNANAFDFSPETGVYTGNSSITVNLKYLNVNISMKNVRVTARYENNRTIKWSFINDLTSPWTNTYRIGTKSTIIINSGGSPIFYIRTQGMDSTSHKSEYNIYSIFI